jgi:ABC-type antimicrobial peptide transport system permease subunit
VADRRFVMLVLTAFGVIALLLAALGIYGVLSYTVALRAREIGVRIALGAQRRGVYRLILQEAGTLALAGIVLGSACAILAASFMRKLLFGTPPWDITTVISVAGVLGASALLASFLPARRAASVDPISALRAE